MLAGVQYSVNNTLSGEGNRAVGDAVAYSTNKPNQPKTTDESTMQPGLYRQGQILHLL
jgi:hypothetical protein